MSLGSTHRWQAMVSSLSTAEEELRLTVIAWQEYEELYAAGCDFIGHIKQIAGEEPVVESGGDVQLLPKFIVRERDRERGS